MSPQKSRVENEFFLLPFTARYCAQWGGRMGGWKEFLKNICQNMLSAHNRLAAFSLIRVKANTLESS